VQRGVSFLGAGILPLLTPRQTVAGEQPYSPVTTLMLTSASFGSESKFASAKGMALDVGMFLFSMSAAFQEVFQIGRPPQQTPVRHLDRHDALMVAFAAKVFADGLRCAALLCGEFDSRKH